MRANRRAFTSIFFTALVMGASLANIGAAPSASEAADVADEPSLNLTQVTARLYVISGGGANIAFFIGRDAVCVVDSGNSPASGARAIALIRAVTDKPLKYLVLTHYHPDHVGGCESFPSSTLIVAQARARDSLLSLKKNMLADLDDQVKSLGSQVARLQAEKSPRLAEVQKELERLVVRRDDWSRRKPVSPALVVESSQRLRLGGEPIELLYWGPGHTDGDLMVLFPGERVLHVGDLFFLNSWVPRLDADAGASVDNWQSIFERLKGLDVQTVIAGHGEQMPKAAFLKFAQRKMDFLRDLKAEVLKLVDKGLPLDEIKRKVELPPYEDMELYAPLLPYNIEGAYREIMARRAARSISRLPVGAWMAYRRTYKSV